MVKRCTLSKKFWMSLSLSRVAEECGSLCLDAYFAKETLWTRPKAYFCRMGDTRGVDRNDGNGMRQPRAAAAPFVETAPGGHEPHCKQARRRSRAALDHTHPHHRQAADRRTDHGANLPQPSSGPARCKGRSMRGSRAGEGDSRRIGGSRGQAAGGARIRRAARTRLPGATAERRRPHRWTVCDHLRGCWPGAAAGRGSARHAHQAGGCVGVETRGRRAG